MGLRGRQQVTDKGKRLAIYVGLPSPDEVQREAELAALDGVEGGGLRPHPLARPDFPWPDFADVRWRGMYTGDALLR